MNHLIILADIGTDLANTGAQTARTFGVDVPHLISQIISFGIVATLLYFFAYKRILQVLEERRQRIADGLANADKIKTELARTEASRQDVLAQANTQSNKFIEEAPPAPARVHNQSTQKAITPTDPIIAMSNLSTT